MMHAFSLFAAPVHAVDGLWTSYFLMAATIVGCLVAGRTRQYFLMYAFGASGLVFGASTLYTFQQSLTRENQQPATVKKPSDRMVVAELTSNPFRPNPPAREIEPVPESEAVAKAKPAPEAAPEKKPRVKPPAVNRKLSAKPVRTDQKKTSTLRPERRFLYVGKFQDGLAPVKGRNGKWGYIDRSQRQVVPCFLEMACTFHAGLGGVMNSRGKWGFVNRKGEVVIPYIYDQALAFEDHKEQAMINMDGQWYWINREGTVLRDATYDDLRVRHRI
jgi:hypothetical protein